MSIIILSFLLLVGCSVSKSTTDFVCTARCLECKNVTLECKSSADRKEVDLGS